MELVVPHLVLGLLVPLSLPLGTLSVGGVSQALPSMLSWLPLWTFVRLLLGVTLYKHLLQVIVSGATRCTVSVSPHSLVCRNSRGSSVHSKRAVLHIIHKNGRKAGKCYG